MKQIYLVMSVSRFWPDKPTIVCAYDYEQDAQEHCKYFNKLDKLYKLYVEVINIYDHFRQMGE